MHKYHYKIVCNPTAEHPFPPNQVHTWLNCLLWIMLIITTHSASVVIHTRHNTYYRVGSILFWSFLKSISTNDLFWFCAGSCPAFSLACIISCLSTRIAIPVRLVHYILGQLLFIVHFLKDPNSLGLWHPFCDGLYTFIQRAMR